MPPSGTAARSAAGVTAYGTCFADGDDPDVSDASSAADTASYRLAEYLSEACPASCPLDSPTDPKRCDFEDWFAPDSSRLSSRPRFLMFPWVSRGGCVAPRSRERLLFQLRSLFTLRSLVSLGRRRCRVSVGTPFLSGVGAPGEAFHDYAGGWFFRPLVVVRYPLLVDAYRLRPQSVFLRSWRCESLLQLTFVPFRTLLIGTWWYRQALLLVCLVRSCPPRLRPVPESALVSSSLSVFLVCPVWSFLLNTYVLCAWVPYGFPPRTVRTLSLGP